MNIFYLHKETKKCAEMHLDKHCVKMILEYAQLLSTAHRVLDGTLVNEVVNGRKKKRYVLNNHHNDVIYQATHINHPSAVWVRQSRENYRWLYDLWIDLIREYNYRYLKEHACMKLMWSLIYTPKNIPDGKFTEPPCAMPDDCKITNSSIDNYREYYRVHKNNMAKWTKRNVPSWYLLSSKIH